MTLFYYLLCCYCRWHFLLLCFFLTNTGGCSRLVISTDNTAAGSIGREDLAWVVAEVLKLPAAKGRVFQVQLPKASAFKIDLLLRFHSNEVAKKSSPQWREHEWMSWAGWGQYFLIDLLRLHVFHMDSNGSQSQWQWIILTGFYHCVSAWLCSDESPFETIMLPVFRYSQMVLACGQQISVQCSLMSPARLNYTVPRWCHNKLSNIGHDVNIWNSLFTAWVQLCQCSVIKFNRCAVRFSSSAIMAHKDIALSTY